MLKVGGGLGALLGRVITAAVDAVAERLVDAVTARRPTVPPPRPRPAPRVRPIRKPREHHVWMSYDDDGVLQSPPPCANCDVVQTHGNRFEPCPGRSTARVW